MAWFARDKSGQKARANHMSLEMGPRGSAGSGVIKGPRTIGLKVKGRIKTDYFVGEHVWAIRHQHYRLKVPRYEVPISLEHTLFNCGVKLPLGVINALTMPSVALVR